jgi:uncharacterized glyoxalase superfamily protein PhnB
MRARIIGLVLCTMLSGTPAGRPQTSTQKEKESKTMKVNRITAVLFVPEVEPCVKFWVERLGFEKTIEVPDGDKRAFAMLQKGGVEVMYQSYASADKDLPAVSQAVRKGPAFLYVEVENLDEIIAAVKGTEVVMPVRTTFYGSKEIGIKDPAGHFITFAQMGAAPQH